MKSASLVVGIGVVVAVGCGSSNGSSSGGGDGGSSSGGSSGSSGSSSSGGGSGSSSGGGSGSGSGSGSSSSGSGSGSSSGSSGSSSGGGMPSVGGILQQPEPWTLDVSGLSPDSTSAAIIAALDAAGGWGNGNTLQIDFSIPLFFADASTPRQTITAQQGNTYCYGGPDCDAVPLQMPIPPNGNAEGSTNYVCDVANNDCHVLVVASNEKKLYELYNSTQVGSAYTALGAFVWDLTKAYPPSERGDQCTSADAAGFPIAGLLPTADEVAAGKVDHAIRFILPNARMAKGVYVHPASHAGGPSSTDANAPPYGVRFRLKSSFDETPFNAGEKTILAAMKKYGMLLSDGGNIALTFADDRTTTAKWATVGVTAQSFGAVTVDDFEVVDLSSAIALTDNCVRNP